MLKNKFIILCLITSTHLAFASELEYPELAVTPRASERLKMESTKEKEHQWKRLWPIQAPAGMTFIAALLQKEKSDASAINGKLIGLLVGSAWIGTTLALSKSYMPYQDGVEETSGMQGKSPREQLIRERLAEEKMSEASKLGYRLKWISFASNFLASGLLIARADKTSNSLAFGGLALLASFTPLVFPLRWISVDTEHQTYKKKIYGQIASVNSAINISATVFPDTTVDYKSMGVAPGLVLGFNW